MFTISDDIRRNATNVTPILVALLVIEVLSRAGLLHQLFFPPPTEIVYETIVLLAYGDLLYHVTASLQRTIISFVIGGTSGIVAGLVMGWSGKVRTILNPYISLLYPVPMIAMLPILFSLFGVNETSRIAMMSLAIFMLVSMNTLGGVLDLDERYIGVALDNGAGTIDLFREVIIPGSLSSIFTGLSLGFGLGFMLLVVIEMISANSGLGYVILQSWRLFTVTRMYAALLIINILGVIFVYGINTLGNYATPWEAA